MTNKLSDLEHVRQCPAMYVGSTEFWGFLNYVVCAYRLLIHWGATRIDLTGNGTLTLSSDATIPADLAGDNPFESISKNHNHVDLDAFIINALSRKLVVFDPDTAYTYDRGRRVGNSAPAAKSTGATLQFAPDDTIFSVTDVESAVLQSYLHRMSYLYPQIRFSLDTEDGNVSFSSPCGIADMFKSISAPYQLLHEPICVSGNDDEFEMDLVFAFHSWTEKLTWTFANAGRAADGGTHDIGLRSALEAFTRKVIANDDRHNRPGYLAIMSFKYPTVQFEGCIKGEIGNAELEAITRDLVGKLLRTIEMKGLPHLKDMSRFKFADFW